jgi:hypothetical protein
MWLAASFKQLKENMPESLKIVWLARLKPLIGRTIVDIRYLDPEECAAMDILHSPLVLQLADGTLLWPMADPEGNDGGALFIQPANKKSHLPECAPCL